MSESRAVSVTLSVDNSFGTTDFSFTLSGTGSLSEHEQALILAQRAVDAYSGAYGLGE